MDLSISQLADQFALNAALLPVLFAGLSEEQLRRPGPEGKWSAYQNLAHLGQFHEVIEERLDLMLSGETRFPPYSPDSAPGLEAWDSKDWPSFQRDFAAARAELVSRLRALPDSAAGRSATHPRFGHLRLPEWLAFWQLHDGHHFLIAAQRAHA